MAQKEKVVVVNPRGQQPLDLRQTPMAPRLDSIDGKTIYIVDVRWPFTHQFSEVMCRLLSERYPNTNFVLRDKHGSYFDDDPELWAEIQEHGDAAIVEVGH